MVYHIDPGVALAVFNRVVEFQVTYGAVLLSILAPDGHDDDGLREDALGNGDSCI